MTHHVIIVGVPAWPNAINAYRALLLICLLVAGQSLWLAHEVEHLAHSDHGDCVVCLTGASLGAAVTAGFPALPPIAEHASDPTPPADQAIPSTAFDPQLPRAPPIAPPR